MSLEQLIVREQTRRHFFSNAGLSIGSLGLASLMAGGELRGAVPNNLQTNPLAPRNTHFDAKAKRVIYLFMAGGPSQLELFDFKPKLQEMDGEVIPESYVEGKNFAFLKKTLSFWEQNASFRNGAKAVRKCPNCFPIWATSPTKLPLFAR